MDARDLSILTGKSVYTPYGSWLPSSTIDSRDSKGNVRYVNPDGLIGEELIYLTAKRYSIEVNIYYKVRGDGYGLKPATRSDSKYRTYYSNTENMAKPAYRACLIQ